MKAAYAVKLAIGVIAAGVLTISAPAAQAVEEPVDSGESVTLSISDESGRVERSSIRSGAKYLNCTVTINNPHYSRGAKGVIAKIRYSCSGNTPGTISLSGHMNRWKPGQYGPFPSMGSNSTTKAVGPGSSGTMYLPSASRNGIGCYESHRYKAYGKSTLRALGQSRTNRLYSAAVGVACP